MENWNKNQKQWLLTGSEITQIRTTNEYYSGDCYEQVFWNGISIRTTHCARQNEQHAMQFHRLLVQSAQVSSITYCNCCFAIWMKWAFSIATKKKTKCNNFKCGHVDVTSWKSSPGLLYKFWSAYTINIFEVWRWYGHVYNGLSCSRSMRVIIVRSL